MCPHGIHEDCSPQLGHKDRFAPSRTRMRANASSFPFMSSTSTHNRPGIPGRSDPPWGRIPWPISGPTAWTPSGSGAMPNIAMGCLSTDVGGTASRCPASPIPRKQGTSNERPIRTIWEAVKGYTEWFPDPTVADAVLERVVHQAYQVTIRGKLMPKILPTSSESGTKDSRTRS